MPNESRFGLVVGIALVVAVGLLFFQNGPAATTDPAGAKSTSTATAREYPSAALPTATSTSPGGKETKGQPTGRVIR